MKTGEPLMNMDLSKGQSSLADCQFTLLQLSDHRVYLRKSADPSPVLGLIAVHPRCFSLSKVTG
jgi:hypothetical protein